MSMIHENENKNNNTTDNSAITTGSMKAQSAGAPGSAGMVGSKKWLKAHTDQMGNIVSSSDRSDHS